MIKYNDLIYYKEDIINAYADRRKVLEKKDVEDLLRCALLFLEQEFKNPNFTAYEIPNIGILHKKLEFSNLEKMEKKIKKEDNFLVECAYLETTLLKPIVMRKDMVDNYYPGIV